MSHNLAYSNHLDWYERGHLASYLSARQTAGSPAMSMIEVRQPAGDMSDPALPCLTIIRDMQGSSVDLNFGAGRFRGRSLPGSLYLAIHDQASTIRVNTPHTVRAFSIPRQLVDETIASAGHDSPDFQRLHNGPFENAVTDALLASLWSSASETAPASQLYVTSAATSLVLNLLRSAQLPIKLERGGLASWQLTRVKDFMRARASHDMAIDELAGLIDLSRKHFARAFRQSTGLPPHRWLMKLRIEKAREMLASGDLPIAEIALACGFADQSHLTAAFRKATGATPGTFRREARM